nr:unnamed protein product [Naegleria fowleri]
MLNFSRPITTTSNVNYESVYSVFNPPVFPFRKQSVRIINSKNGLVEYEIIAKLEGVETLFNNNGKREDGCATPKDDVVKNVIHELARSYPIENEDVTVEAFAIYLAKHLLKEFEQFINSVALTVEMSEWVHLDENNENNGFFKNQPDSVRFAHLSQMRGQEPQLCSGIKLFEITGNQSSLQMNTSKQTPLQAIWKYSNVDLDEYFKHEDLHSNGESHLDFNDIFKQVKQCLVDCIGDLDMKGHSLNLHQVCNVILERVPRVKSVHLSAPMPRNTEATTSNSRYRNDVCQTFSEAFVSRHVALPLHYHPARNLAHHHHWGNHLHRMNRDFYGRRDFVSKL